MPNTAHQKKSVRRSQLIKEWHQDKNKGDLDDFFPSSRYRAWWKCSEGHEWQCSISSRMRGWGICKKCPRLAPKEKRLSLIHPHLTGEWHSVKNGNLRPKHFSHGSSAKVWWICKKGHEWQAQIAQRALGSGCPECSGQAVGKDNNLRVRNPGLAEEWHPNKNGNLSPEAVTSGSNKHVWWKCPKGHEWRAQISKRHLNRNGRGSGCPECSGKQVGEDNNLLYLYPDVAKEWHPTRNGDLRPSDIIAGSYTKVWWKCSRGHEWQTSVQTRCRNYQNRKKLPGCPECAGKKVGRDNNLLAVNPKLAKEWHPTKNGSLKPEDVLPGKKKKVWWICKKGHEWEARIDSRSNSNGCGECSGRSLGKTNNLAYINPALAKEWHPTKNGTLEPKDFLAGSEKHAWWLCAQGHEWKSRIASRNSGSGCPNCRKGGYKTNKKGYVYLMYSSKYSCWQIGITNDPKSRIKQHEEHSSFKVKELLCFDQGALARELEQEVLRYWRAKGYPAALSGAEMPQGGWSETVSSKDVKSPSLQGWTKSHHGKDVTGLFQKK